MLTYTVLLLRNPEKRYCSFFNFIEHTHTRAYIKYSSLSVVYSLVGYFSKKKTAKISVDTFYLSFITYCLSIIIEIRVDVIYALSYDRRVYQNKCFDSCFLWYWYYLLVLDVDTENLVQNNIRYYHAISTRIIFTIIHNLF